jgi:pimeloyl-ACP methyl ester carboxylesterase
MGSLVTRCIFQPPPITMHMQMYQDLVEFTDPNNIAFVHVKPSHPDKTMPWIVYCHGNATNVLGIYSILQQLSETLGANVLAFEYPGYHLEAMGQGDKVPSSDQEFYEYIDRVVQFLQTRIELTNCVFLGQSLGSAMATYVAAKYNVQGLILLSPFTSVRDVVFAHDSVVGSALFMSCCNRFVNDILISDIACPIAILHGTKDDVVPYKQGRILFDRCESSVFPRFYPLTGKSHNFSFSEFSDIGNIVKDFIYNYKQHSTL